MGAIQGRLVLIKVGAAGSEKVLAGTLSHSLKIGAEMQDATTKDSPGDWEEVIPGTKNGSFSVQGVFDPDAATGEGALDMFDILAAGTKVHLIFGPTASGSEVKEADAYVESLTEEAPLKDRTTYTVDFKATGAITRTTVV